MPLIGSPSTSNESVALTISRNGAIAGGWIAQHLNWRLASFMVGAPGLLIAALTSLLATLVGTLAALALWRRTFRGRSLLREAGITQCRVNGFGQPCGIFWRNKPAVHAVFD
mgnify:CR=1 FL=1